MKKANQIKLVIVDDAPFIREIVQQLVSSDSGIKIVGEAVDGTQAVDLAKKKKPDVILMDIVLPNMNGIEASKKILESQPKIKIIACSTIGQETMIMKALEAGCSNYLVKPFSKEQLLQAIHYSSKEEEIHG